MEEAMVIRRDGTGKRFGVLAVLMAAVFLVFMGTHTVYGAGGLDLNTEYGLSGNIGKAGRQPEYSCHTGELHRGQSECGFGDHCHA